MFGLSFLPSEEVGDVFVELMSIKPEITAVNKFANYLVDNYIDEDKAKFHSSLWAAFDCNSWRTTNGCEAFHSKFNSSCSTTHPNINDFIAHLQRVQTDTYIKINSVNNGVSNEIVISPDRNFILEKIEQLKRKEFDNVIFVKLVSHHYAV